MGKLEKAKEFIAEGWKHIVVVAAAVLACFGFVASNDALQKAQDGKYDYNNNGIIDRSDVECAINQFLGFDSSTKSKASIQSADSDLDSREPSRILFHLACVAEAESGQDISPDDAAFYESVKKATYNYLNFTLNFMPAWAA